MVVLVIVFTFRFYSKGFLRLLGKNREVVRVFICLAYTLHTLYRSRTISLTSSVSRTSIDK